MIEFHSNCYKNPSKRDGLICEKKTHVAETFAQSLNIFSYLNVVYRCRLGKTGERGKKQKNE